MANQTVSIETASGSSYEIDPENKLIRRVSGTHPVTERQSADGEWQPYHSLTPLENFGLVIDWAGDGKCTVTSNVISHAHTELVSLLT